MVTWLTSLQIPYNKIRLISLLLISFSFPFSIPLNGAAIILLFLNWIAERDFSNKFEKFKQNRIIWLFVSFYIFHLVGMFYTSNKNAGWFDLEKKFSLLLFPIILGTSSVISKNDIHKILFGFIIACTIGCISCFINATNNFLVTGSTSFFYSEKLSFFMHRVYFSMYLLFSLYLIIYFISEYLEKKFRYIGFFFIAFFTLFIILLGSRMVIMLFFINGFVFLIYFTINKKKYKIGLLVFIFLLLSLGGILSNDKIRIVMRETFTDLDKGNSEANFSGPNQRVIQWKCAIEIIRKEYLMGVGTGDTEDVLLQKYVEHDFQYGIQSKYNAHNQILQTWIGLGLGGLSLFLFYFLSPLKSIFINKNYLYAAFLMLFLGCCLSESMLCAQKGVVFFAFFNSLFCFHSNLKHT